ncbi:MAG: NDP-sugar synthase [Desulfurococcaceae archaeon]
MPTAVVLAGGVGSRLYPLTKVVPKPLIPFAGAPLLDYIIETLKQNGFNNIIITARYLGGQIVKYYESVEGVKPLLLDSKDTADAIRLIADHIKGEFLVSMGDVVTNIPFFDFYKYHLFSNSTASIVLKEVDNPLPYGLVYIDEKSNIVLFCEKPPSLEIYLLSIAFHAVKSPGFHGNLVNAGIYAFNEEVKDILLENKGLMDFGRHVFPYLLENGYIIKGWIAPPDTYWNDIGRVEVYKEAIWDFLEGKVKGWNPRGRNISRGIIIALNASLHGSIIPPVYLGDNVIVDQGSIIGPYAVIEKNTVIEESSRVSYSIIWSNTLIRKNTYIYDSVIMNHAEVKNGVRIVSSVVGSGCVVENDLFKQVLEPCKQVSPYENTW